MNSHRGILNKGASTHAQNQTGKFTGQNFSINRVDLAPLAVLLIKERSIRTTGTKARRLRPFANQLVELALRGDRSSRNKVSAMLGDADAANTLIVEIAPRITGSPGSYTKVRKVVGRGGRSTSMAIVALVLEDPKQYTVSLGSGFQSAELQQNRAAGRLTPPASPTRTSTNKRVLTTIDRPLKRSELEEIGSILGIPVRNCSSPEIWTLGLGNLNDDEDNPAIIRIVRSQGKSEGIDIEIAWQGGPPPPEAIAKITDSVTHINKYIRSAL